jgi:hypothetical protein
MPPETVVRFLLLFFLSITLFSCEVINPKEDLPAYIRIDSISLNVTDPQLQGTASHKITDAWVYLNDNIIGVYELPVKFPLLASGNNNIKIRPGIKINGISASRAAYPFYKFFETTVDLKALELYSISPVVVEYHASTTFAWMNDFSANDIGIDRLPNSDTIVLKVTDPSVLIPSLNGSACGGIFLDETHKNFAAASPLDKPLALPKDGRYIFLELNYKNNQEFTLGVIARNPNGDDALMVAGVNPSSEWNKIYINLTETVTDNQRANGFYFFIYAEKSASVSKGEIYIDNLKMLH